MRLSRLNVRVDNKYHKKLPETGVEFLVNYMIAWTLTLSCYIYISRQDKETYVFVKRGARGFMDSDIPTEVLDKLRFSDTPISTNPELFRHFFANSANLYKNSVAKNIRLRFVQRELPRKFESLAKGKLRPREVF